MVGLALFAPSATTSPDAGDAPLAILNDEPPRCQRLLHWGPFNRTTPNAKPSLSCARVQGLEVA